MTAGVGGAGQQQQQQSRAFYMKGGRLVTDPKEKEGADVFLLPAIDMVNHASDDSKHNATLERLGMEPGGLPSTGYFSLKASRLIRRGEQVLISYGELSDMDLLVTYGFIDVVASSQQAAPQYASRRRNIAELPNLENPSNAALIPWSTVVDVCRATCTQNGINEHPEKSPFDVEADKCRFLGYCKVLQHPDPFLTTFPVTRMVPMTDELLTAVQVMLLTDTELQDLKNKYDGVKKETKAEGAGAEGGAAAAKKEGGEEEQKKEEEEPSQPSISNKERLSLGVDRLREDPDFNETVAFTLSALTDACMANYPTDMSEDAALLTKAQSLPYRKRLAVMGRLGEKETLQLAKKQAALMMMGVYGARPSAKRGRGGAPVDHDGEEAPVDDSDDEVSEPSEEDDSESDGSDDPDDDDSGRGSDMEPSMKRRRAPAPKKQMHRPSPMSMGRGYPPPMMRGGMVMNMGRGGYPAPSMHGGRGGYPAARMPQQAPARGGRAPVRGGRGGPAVGAAAKRKKKDETSEEEEDFDSGSDY
eukprot:gene20558-27350_t